jgi:hypothetical protein
MHREMHAFGTKFTYCHLPESCCCRNDPLIGGRRHQKRLGHLLPMAAPRFGHADGYSLRSFMRVSARDAEMEDVVLRKLHCETGASCVPTEEAKHGKLGREGSGEVQGRGWERHGISGGGRESLRCWEGMVCRGGDGSITRLRDAFPG